MCGCMEKLLREMAIAQLGFVLWIPQLQSNVQLVMCFLDLLLSHVENMTNGIQNLQGIVMIMFQKKDGMVC